MKSIGSIGSIGGTRNQSGAVSIFVVIFAILLMSVVTVSFLRLMINDQSQASNNDLSQSAYDSAQAGVEDAKRALLWYVEQCAAAPGSCSTLASQMNSTVCNQAIVNVAKAVKAGDVASTGGASGVGEVKVQQSSTVDASGDSIDEALDQAYTCVLLELDTQDYVGSVTAAQPILVPLTATAGFTAVTVQWFSLDDVSNGTGAVNLPAAGSQPLVNQASWPADRPLVLRTQYMQIAKGGFTLDSFDYYNSAAGQSNTNTVFLYPSSSGSSSEPLISRDIRKEVSGSSVAGSSLYTPLPARCVASVSAGGYACSMTLQLPAPIGGGDATAYLLLTPTYTGTHFRVTLNNGAQFKGVQPVVDSTGRAGSAFRRVKSRIDLYATSPYVGGAVDVTEGICKTFGVTDTEYIAASCTP